MRFISHEKVHSLYLILILLNYGTIGQCALVERHSKSTSSTSSSTSSSHSHSSSTSTHSQSSTSTSSCSTHTSTTSQSHSSSSHTSIAGQVVTPIVDPPPASYPVAKTPSLSGYGSASSPGVKGPISKTAEGPLAKTTESPEAKPSNGPATNSGYGAQGPPAKPSSSSSSSSSPSPNGNGWWSWGNWNANSAPTTYITDYVTMTSAPNWGPQPIPINTCTSLINNHIHWIPCMVTAGTIHLSYFPEASGNVTYPSTYFAPELGLTMTSPSVYMVLNTLWATNDCGRLGPTYTSYVLPMDLTDIWTMVPYADETARDRPIKSRTLTLADIVSNCPDYVEKRQTEYNSDGIPYVPHPINDDWNRCHPMISQPATAKSIASPYWRHCGNGNGRFGIFDPPGAVPPVGGLFPTTPPTPYVPPTTPANPAPTVQPPAAPTYSPGPPPAPTYPQDTQPPPSTPDAPPPNSPNPQPEPTTPNQPSPAEPQPPTPTPDPPTPIAIIGSNTIIAAPGATNLVLPNGSPATIGAITTINDSNNNPVTVSIAPSGMIIQQSGTYSFIPNPSPRPKAEGEGNIVPFATLGTLTLSARPGDSTVVIAEQTVTKGGPPITLPNSHNVATLGPNALIIQYPSGIASTFLLPTAVQAQVTAAPTPVPVPALNNIPITPLPGGSAVQIGTKTISIGGPVATIQETTVVTLAPAGLIIQKPGGVEITVSIPGLGNTATTTTTSANGNGNGNVGIGGIIASIDGIAPIDSPSPTPVGDVSPWTVITTWPPTSSSTRTNSATGTSTEEPTIFTGAGSRVVASRGFSVFVGIWWVWFLGGFGR